MDKIYNEDCLEGMQRLADNSVDFVLTDLPFQITDCAWDKKIDLERFWAQIKRVTKENAAIALFGASKFTYELYNSQPKLYRYKWIWQKTLAAGFLNANKMPLRSYEEILIFYRKLPTYNPQFTQGKPYERKNEHPSKQNCYQNYAELGHKDKTGKRYPHEIICFNNQHSLWGRSVTAHPTQKPVDLLEYLIKTYTNEGETVLDATIGSGSTAMAAINTNRHFIGFELDEHFYNIALQRIEAAGK